MSGKKTNKISLAFCEVLVSKVIVSAFLKKPEEWLTARDIKRALVEAELIENYEPARPIIMPTLKEWQEKEFIEVQTGKEDKFKITARGIENANMFFYSINIT